MDDPDLLEIGLHLGDLVRYRPRANARWQEGTVVRRERDGSVGITDAKGAARALPIERLEVPTAGPRGARTWEPLAERAARDVQLDLFLDSTDPDPPDPDGSPPRARRRPTRRPDLSGRARPATGR